MEEERVSDKVALAVAGIAATRKIIARRMSDPKLACIEFEPPLPERNGPPREERPFAVLPIGNGAYQAYCIYDRLFSRIVAGPFVELDSALASANAYNDDLKVRHERRFVFNSPPNGDAIGLIYEADDTAS